LLGVVQILVGRNSVEAAEKNGHAPKETEASQVVVSDRPKPDPQLIEMFSLKQTVAAASR